MDFSGLFLTPGDVDVLMELSGGGVGQYHPIRLSHLFDLNFVALYSDGVGYVITPDGLRFVEYFLQKQSLSNKQDRRARISLTCSVLGTITGAASLIWHILNTLSQ